MVNNNILHGPKIECLEEECLAKLILKVLNKQKKDDIVMVDLKTNTNIRYGKLLESWTILTSNLRKLGIQKDDIMAVLSSNCWKYSLPLLAGFCIGAPCHIINPDYTYYELKHILSLSKPKIVFVAIKALSNILALRAHFPSIDYIVTFDECDDNTADIISMDTLMEPNETVTPITVDDFDPKEQVALIGNSSGTTGMPKGVMVTHAGLAQIFVNQRYDDFRWIHPGEAQLLFLPFFHVYGANLLLLGLMESDIKNVIVSKFVPNEFLSAIETYRIRSLCMVPTVMNFMAKSDLVSQYDLSCLTEIYSSGAAASEAVCDIILKRFNVPVIRHLYGMTESVTCISVIPKNVHLPKSVGCLYPGRKLKIRDVETKKTLGVNDVGEICVSGPIMKGYLNEPEKTAEAIDEDGFLGTGDVGYFDECGYIYLVERMKDLIKYKSFQVPPTELESVLLKHPAVKDTAVVGKPDERSGEVPVAFIVKEPNTDVSEQELVDHVAEYLSITKRLYGGVKFIEEIPKNLTGKILRKELRQMLSEKNI